MQMYIITAASFLSLTNNKSLAYRGLILFNCVSAAASIYPMGLYTEITESTNLLMVLLYGFGGIIGLLLFTFVVAKIPRIPIIVQRKIFHIPPFIMFPLLNAIAR